MIDRYPLNSLWKAAFGILVTLFAMPGFAAQPCATSLSLLSIREIAQKKGVTVVTNHVKNETRAKHHDEELLYGVKIVHAPEKEPRRPQKLEGVVIHLGDAHELSHSVQGRINLTQNSRAGKTAVENKWKEYVFVDSVWPGAMPRSINAQKLIDDHGVEEFKMSRHQSLMAANEFLESARALPRRQERMQILNTVKLFFDYAKAEFPEGAFIKNTGEAQTGDSHNLIRTFKESPEALASRFIRDLALIKKKKLKLSDLKNETLEEEIIKIDHGSSIFILALLTAPSEVMVQEKVEVAEIEGFNAEVRVDFASGIAINATPRYTLAYMPELLEKAKKFTQKFLSRIPEASRKVSGGADVVFLTDGSMRLLELNMGADSGFIFAPMETIPAHEFISETQGAPTDFILDLERVFNSGLREQRRALKDLRAQYTAKKQSLDDLSVVEVATWFRNRHVEEWKKNPTQIEGRKTLLTLRQLLQNPNKTVQKDLNGLYVGASQYISLYLKGGIAKRIIK